jgi:hypothetical protein
MSQPKIETYSDLTGHAAWRGSSGPPYHGQASTRAARQHPRPLRTILTSHESPETGQTDFLKFLPLSQDYVGAASTP